MKSLCALLAVCLLAVTPRGAHGQELTWGPSYGDCLKQYWATDEGQQWLAFENDCGEAIQFEFCMNDDSSCHMYNLEVAAQQGVGISAAEWNEHGGSVSFACKAGYIPADATGNSDLTATKMKQGVRCKLMDPSDLGLP
jgi:hypothetical protein